MKFFTPCPKKVRSKLLASAQNDLLTAELALLEAENKLDYFRGAVATHQTRVNRLQAQVDVDNLEVRAVPLPEVTPFIKQHVHQPDAR